MESFINDSSLFLAEENLPDSSSLEWFVSEQEPVIEPEDEEEKEAKHTLYHEEKKEGKTDTPVEPALKEIGSMVKEYENWEGRVVSTDKRFVRARLVNTQHHYSPRIVRIDRTIFSTNGIKRELAIGDMFELTFRYVSIETINKRNQLAFNNRYIDTLRMIEPVTLTRKEIEAITTQKLKTLSYLFKNGHID